MTRTEKIKELEIAIDIKERRIQEMRVELEKLENDLPKRGDYYRDKGTKHLYIVAVAGSLYVLCNLRTGGQYCSPTSLDRIFAGDEDEFERVEQVTITPR